MQSFPGRKSPFFSYDIAAMSRFKTDKLLQDFPEPFPRISLDKSPEGLAQN
jgi:hypothetical protein